LDPEQYLINSNSVSKQDLAEIQRIHAPSLFEKFSYLVGPSVFKTISKSAWILQLLSYIGEIANFLIWQKKTFGTLNIFVSKRRLYLSIVSKLKCTTEFEIFEFGVAHGHTTHLLIHEFQKQGIKFKRYIGFDTFTGLEQDFRNFPKGSFDNQGKFPNLSADNLFWSKGLVQITVPNTNFALTSRKLWIFDLDLYDATYSTVVNVLPVMQPEDIIYFDEAFDPNEFKIVTEIILKTFDCLYIGTNGQALALEVKSKLNV
jgi:hypothetical protein